MQGTTASGFKFNIPKTRMDDIRFLKAVRDMKADFSKVLDMVEILLKDDEERLYQHLQKGDGRVPITDVQKEITEIINIIGKNPEGKK